MNIRDAFLKISTVLVLAVYILSLGGINVHSCSHSGEVSVTLLSGTVSCHCHDHAAAGDHDDCCSNDSYILLTEDGNDHLLSQVQVPPPAAMPAPEISLPVVSEGFHHFHSSFIPEVLASDGPRLFVLRV